MQWLCPAFTEGEGDIVFGADPVGVGVTVLVSTISHEPAARF